MEKENRIQKNVVNVDENLIPDKRMAKAIRHSATATNIVAGVGVSYLALEKFAELFSGINNGKLEDSDPLFFIFKIGAIVVLFIAAGAMNEIAEGKELKAKKIEEINSLNS